MSMLKNSLSNFFLLLFFFTPVFSLGQGVPITSSIPELEEQIYVNLSNDFPKPLENVKIDIEAYGFDLNKATITWKVNGVTVKTGIGERVFEVQAGKLGVTKKISITIQPVVGIPLNKSVTISPQEIDLVWEARTYTPPFYKGKAMYTPQENVVIVAMPNFISSNGDKIASDKLIYKWEDGGEAVQDQSGYGKNVFKLKGSILLKTNDISVDITGFGKEKARESLALAVTFPEAIFYENNPLYGILFNKSLVGNFSFEEEEKNIEVFPYFFGTSRKSDPKLSYEWRINNKNIFVPKTQNSMVFRNTEGGEGRSLVGVTISNTGNFLEEARGSVNLNYSTPKKNSF
jgi:hypothetical protein